MNEHPHRVLFSHYPLFQIALAFSAGIVTAKTVHIQVAITIGLAATCSMFAVLMLWRTRLTIAGVSVLSAFFFSGASLTRIEDSAQRPDGLKTLIEDEQQVSLTGVLNEPPDFARDRVYITLDVESLNSSGNELKVNGLVSLLASFKTATSEQEYRHLNLRYGTRIRVKTTLNRANRYRNPGVSSLTDFMDAKGLDAVGLIKSPAAIARLDEISAFKPMAWLYGWREIIQRKVDECFSADTAGVLAAALLGNRYNLTKVSADRFREGGTFHVLVISGVHISFIGGLVLLIAQRLTRRRVAQFVLSSSVVWSYSLAVGAGASVIRAAWMFTLIALGQVVFRSASALNSLGAASLFLLAHRPGELFDPSFQLTFLSVLAIVTLAWPIIQTCNAIGSWRPTRATPYPPSCSRALRWIADTLYWSEIQWQAEIDRSSHSYRLFKSSCAGWLERKHLQRFVRYVANAVIVSISVQIVLLPLFIVYFHRISWSSLLLNIVVSVMLAILCFVALGAMLISELSLTLATPLFHLTEFVEWLMVHSVDPFLWIGVSASRLPEYSGWSNSVYVTYYVPLVLLLVRLSRWRPLELNSSTSFSPSLWLGVIIQSSLILVVLLHPLSAGNSTGKLQIDFLDVGQGDAALVTMPDGATLLVDGGGQPSFFSANGDSVSRDRRSIGEMVVAEYLWWRGLDSIDYVLVTHADADHIDGLNDVVRNFTVRSALVGRRPQNDAEFSKFVATLQATGIHLEIVQAGDVLNFGEATATVLWPVPLSDANSRSGNNESVVLRLQFRDVSILLTGDIEKEAESQILASGADLRADVIKVAHHGSKTSSLEPFVRAVQIRYAIISVGQKSMFGHPHREVVDRWKQSGAEVLTTGDCGTITVTTDGKNVTLKKFVDKPDRTIR